MDDKHPFVILVAVTLLAGIWGLVLLVSFFGNLSIAFFLGVPIGILFGLGTSKYFSTKWDPKGLESKGSQRKNEERVFLLIPIIIFLARILSDVLNGIISEILMGTIITWASFALGYIALQAYRYRPK